MLFLNLVCLLLIGLEASLLVFVFADDFFFFPAFEPFAFLFLNLDANSSSSSSLKDSSASTFEAPDLLPF